MKGLFAVPLGLPFLPELARGLIEATASSPSGLASLCVIVPTQRACSGLQEAFSLATPQQQGRILPRIIALADIENGDCLPGYLPPALHPPALSPFQRLGLLSQLILEFEKQKGQGITTPARALQLAQELAHLVDEAETMGLGLSHLKTLVGADYASHWQLTLDFLKILTDHWPGILSQQGCTEPEARKRMILEQVAQHWCPDYPVILAGTTGTRPATALLINAILKQEKGCVVLPGVDPSLIGHNDDDPFSQPPDFLPSHPQYTLSNLIKKVGRPQLWPSSGTSSLASAKAVFLSKVMASPKEEEKCLSSSLIRHATRDFHAFEAASTLEEARQIALIMRYELETPGQVIALVTPDATLTRQVQAALGRWGIHANTAKGRPLSQTLVGRFLMSSAALAPDMDAISLLGLLKHPLYAKGKDRGHHLTETRAFELKILRGQTGGKPAYNRHNLSFPGQALAQPLLDLHNGRSHPFADFLHAHKTVAEALAGDKNLLWAEEDGHTAASLWESMQEKGAAFPPLNARDYPHFLRTLLDQETVRDGQGVGSRLLIVGTREARFLSADVIILSGLNEGVWPAIPRDDPWLSRSMRESFGLPPVEQRAGLSAHDFCMALAAPKVYMGRSLNRDGAPAIPSRWWQRITAALEAGGATLPLSSQWAEWSGQLDQPSQTVAFIPPAPCPPLSVRPRRLSVTAVETLLRDPYSIYAKMVLNLRPLNPLEMEISLADRGQVIHSVLESFIRLEIDPAAPDAFAKFESCARQAFQPLAADPRATAFWWPRLMRLGEWLLGQMAKEKSLIAKRLTEIEGILEIPTSTGLIQLTAKADRIDVLTKGGVRIIDYKTGAVPTQKSVYEGYAPQLPLEGLIIKAGGFKGLPPALVEELCYWKVTGGTPPAETSSLKNIESLLAAAEEGVHLLFEKFLTQETPFYACPDPQVIPPYHDYAHLERLKEWG